MTTMRIVDAMNSFDGGEPRRTVSLPDAKLSSSGPVSGSVTRKQTLSAEMPTPPTHPESHDLRERLVTVLLSHETSYVQRNQVTWEWSCKCGANDLCNTWEACHELTRQHWADAILPLIESELAAFKQLPSEIIAECDRHAEFLKYEAEHGGAHAYLMARREEALYVRAHVRNLLAQITS